MKKIMLIGKMLLLGMLTVGVMTTPAVGLTVDAKEQMVVVEQKEMPDYQIRVNRSANCVTVYTKDDSGKYTVPVRSFACSCGKEGRETPLGNFQTSDYYQWRVMVDGSYGQYAIRFNQKILFHSVPYYSNSNDAMEKEQFNLLGNAASLGCVRMAAGDVKWLYDNCEKDTSVIVYDNDSDPGPLGKPIQMQINPNHPYAVWDPTDPNPENPWNTIRPSLYLKQDMGDGVLYVPAGTTPEQLKQYVGVKNAKGIVCAPQNYQLYVNGNYDLNKPGTYRVWISGWDATGVMVQQEIVLAVVKL